MLIPEQGIYTPTNSDTTANKFINIKLSRMLDISKAKYDELMKLVKNNFKNLITHIQVFIKLLHERNLFFLFQITMQTC